MDFLSPTARSELMSRIRGKNTSPELKVRRYLHSRGLRYRLNDPTLPGKPDITLRSRKAVIFVHGCFWHGHAQCSKARTPKSNTEFWLAKVATNAARDRRVARALRKAGWRVFVIWQCQIDEQRLRRLYRAVLEGER